MNRTLTLALALALLASWPAWAGSDTLSIKDGAGATKTFGVTTDGSSNLYANTVLVDGTAAANKAAVTSASALKVDGSAVTQPVSAASLPLPTGASSLAKQPALGTAGTASADVITVQGIASMTALKVDGSAVTQPVSAASLPLPALAATSTKQSDGTQKSQVVDGSGNVIGSTSNALDVNVKSGGTVSQGSTTSGQGGSLVMGAVTTSAPSYTTAQTSPVSLTVAGAQRMDLASLAGTTTVNGGLAGSQSVGGTVATNVAITDNPLNTGFQAISSENTAVTATRKVQGVADLTGKQIVLPYANPENFVSGVISSAMTGTTSTSLVAAPATGLRNYITSCTLSNSHATVGTDLILQDGSGGTTIWVAPAAAVYGGSELLFPTPLRQPTTATALYAANVTTGASTKIACAGYKGV